MTTSTYATLAVTARTFDEIRRKLADAGYETRFTKNGERFMIEMHGLALVEEEQQKKQNEHTGRKSKSDK